MIKSVVHAFGSSVSASVGILAPRYSISESGLYYLAIFIVGIIFLAFDVRARDDRERMLEVLDSRHYSNLDLVFGRFVGIFLSAWIPVVILVFVIQGLGWLLPQLGSPFGGTIEPLSLFSFPFFIALPAMAFSCSLVILITLLVKHRFASLLLSGAAIFGLFSLSSGALSSTISSSLDLLGFFQISSPSDLISSISPSFVGWVQRIGIVVLSLSLVLFAALVHPRLETGSRSKQTLLAVTLTIIGVSLLSIVSYQKTQQVDEIEHWRTAHEAKRDHVFPDILSMRSQVNIDPGKEVAVELKIDFKAPKTEDIEQALFSLNPGFIIESITDADGNSIEVVFQDGLLIVSLDSHLKAGMQTSLQLSYRGKPNTRFAYLDSAISPGNLQAKDAAVALLGTSNAIFDEEYVALMPGIHWLPASGVDVDHGDTHRRSKDFYDLQLQVRVPPDWIVAGPGLRKENAKDSNSIEYDFSPQTFISEVALLAAPFKSYVTKIDDINFELLLSLEHDSNLDSLAKGKEQIKLWIADKLSLARDAGLEYPFRAFTLVEVPNTLRSYSGGWKNGTALAPPSMVLMKESSLPTARFDFDAVETFGPGRPLKDREDGPAKIIRNRLIGFFNNDFIGGNVFTGIAKSFFAHQTSAAGSDAIALDYTLQQLTTLVVSEQQSYFSPSRMSDVVQSVGNTMGTRPERTNRVSERMMRSFSKDVDVWESAMDSPLNDIDPWKKPALTVDLLALKGGGMAKLIYDILGPEKSGQLIAMILANHRGTTYTRADVIAAGNQLDSELGRLIDDWFTTTGLAGFTSEEVQLYQLPGNNSGDNRFQFKMRIKNEEAATGFARVSWITGESVRRRTVSEPIRVEGNSTVEFGIVLSQQPIEVYIEPYVSLNRQGFLVKRFLPGDIRMENKETYSGVRQVANKTPDDSRIIVDDLDTTFQVLTADSDEGFRIANRSWQGVTDQGLPATNGWEPVRWSRRSEPSAWGKYRHTIAYVRPGDGSSKAVFKAKIPAPGRWQLEVHLPSKNLTRQKEFGKFELTVVTENLREPLYFDAKQNSEGWTLVGDYELSIGDVLVEFSNQTDGEIVIADAIAWSRKE